ncbi:MAG: rubrerythrin family protein [Nanoarchaeota archaeon]|nr:rubrerythrin family protein [Nanoarchaeota archaeon]
MKQLKGSETEKNLLKAFAGESQARMRYTYFSSVAKKEGFEQMAELFLETAENEKEHAKIFFKYLQGGMVEITASYPAGMIGTTKENLLAAAEGEKEEYSLLYPSFSATAAKEGFPDIAYSFKAIAKIEELHEKRYRVLLENLEKGEVFKKDEKGRWVCRNCGHVFEGYEAPAMCPVCKHPQAFFEQEKINY